MDERLIDDRVYCHGDNLGADNLMKTRELDVPTLPVLIETDAALIKRIHICITEKVKTLRVLSKWRVTHITVK